MLEEHERTMAFAEIAFGQIKALRQPASPRHFEIWYTYATGYNPPLNKIINETLARNGRLTEADLEQIYETYLSQIKTTDRIDKVGARVIGEIDDVMNLITEALAMSARYDDSLSGASRKLEGSSRSKNDRGDPPWPKLLVDLHHGVATPDKDDVDREAHEEHVHPHERRESPILEQHPRPRLETVATEQAPALARKPARILEPRA